MPHIYSNLKPHHFLGKFIKLSGTCMHPGAYKMSEDFIKVKVVHLVGLDSPTTTELVGQIIHQSNPMSEYQNGDLIAFRKEEIVEMYAEGNC